MFSMFTVLLWHVCSLTFANWQQTQVQLTMIGMIIGISFAGIWSQTMALDKFKFDLVMALDDGKS